MESKLKIPYLLLPVELGAHSTKVKKGDLVVHETFHTCGLWGELQIDIHSLTLALLRGYFCGSDP